MKQKFRTIVLNGWEKETNRKYDSKCAMNLFFIQSNQKNFFADFSSTIRLNNFHLAVALFDFISQLGEIIAMKKFANERTAFF